MRIKFITPLLTTLGLSMLLGGCGDQHQSAANTTSKKEQSSKITTTSQIHNQQSNSSSIITNDKNYWNDTKAKNLATFMASWGQAMHQQYESFYPGKNTNFYGCAFPDDFGKYPLKVNDQTVTMQWSKNGNGKTDYNVVAIYSDCNTIKSMGAHLYFFTIHNQQPVVLISQQTNGDLQHNGLHFTLTKNQDLANGFQQIVAGKTPAKLVNSSDNNSQQTTDTFPENMQGTWYSYDDDNQLHTITITKNTIQENGEYQDCLEIHPISERSAADQQYLNNPSDSSAMDPQRENWGYLQSVNGHWLKLDRWYQTAGAGEDYRVVNQNINGQQVPVLEEAGGAGIWLDSNYYHSKDIAQQMNNHCFDDESQRPSI